MIQFCLLFDFGVSTLWYGSGSFSEGSLQSRDWKGGMEWWNGIVECVLQGEGSLLVQFSCFIR